MTSSCWDERAVVSRVLSFCIRIMVRLRGKDGAAARGREVALRIGDACRGDVARSRGSRPRLMLVRSDGAAQLEMVRVAAFLFPLRGV